MSEVISFRLDKDNPREAIAWRVLQTRIAKGHNIRHIITEALIKLDQSEQVSTPPTLDELNETLCQVNRFLKHIERTKLLVHLIDITYIPVHDILEDFYTLTMELERYNPSLIQKEQIVLINKMDLYSPEHRDIDCLKKVFNDMGLESLSISALTSEGIEELKQILSRKFFHE